MSTATSRALRLHLPVLVLAAAPALLALRYGGFHPRHWGWLALILVCWACVQAARGRFPAPRSLGGIASLALLGLTAWTTASIAWADVSTHDAWVEAVRVAGYTGAVVVASSILANVHTYARFVALSGGALGTLALVTLVRTSRGDDSLTAFVAGRLDWPVGYAPGLAALHVIGALLLVGTSCGAARRWERTRATSSLVLSAGALAGAGACAVIAALAQSRGTLPALVVGVAALLVATPRRTDALLRLGAVTTAIVAVWQTLGDAFQTQFAYRQAPFTPGADADRLLDEALAAAHDAGRAGFLVVAALCVGGAALVPLGSWLTTRVANAERRIGASLAVPLSALVVTLVATLAVLGVGERSPASWARAQWTACLDPPSQVNDPGSGTSYFANTGTGRCDYYRVALLDTRDHPLLGTGAGNFAGSYVRERTTREEPTTAHSLPLQLLGELGILGGALGLVFLGCVGAATWRFVRSGVERDPAFAGAVAAIAYWVVHASIDWLWQLPAVTLGVLLLCGGLMACASPGQLRVRAQAAAPFAAAGILLALALVLPPTMADSSLRRARDAKLQQERPREAVAAARRAQGFDPGWAEPFIVEGVVQLQQGNVRGAARAARSAIAAEPENWSVQHRASSLLARSDTRAAARALDRARELNPQLREPAAAPAG